MTVKTALVEIETAMEDAEAEGYEAEYADVVESVLYGYPKKVQKDVCLRTMGYVPSWVK